SALLCSIIIVFSNLSTLFADSSTKINNIKTESRGVQLTACLSFGERLFDVPWDSIGGRRQ
ncbi:hypothetical protein, partial [Levilactobacillus bambusae]|uniref:hypothetical protein n=1 Tax=Levilactobacillus bambusae TaxID=2024736 RepID=UPI001CDAEE52